MIRAIWSYLLLFSTLLASAQSGTDEQLAAQYFKNGEFEKSAVLYDKLYRKSGDEFYYRYYIDCLLELKDYDEAARSVEKRLKKGPDPLLSIELGSIYKKAGDEKKCQALYEKAVQELEPSQYAVATVADAFISKGELEWAEKAYLRGRKILGGTEFYFELADVYARLGKFDLQLAELLNALDHDAGLSTKVRSNLSESLINDPSGKKVEYFESALTDRIQREPDRDHLADLLIWHLIQKKDFQGAFLQAKALDRRRKEDGSRLVELAHIAKANRDFDVAAEAFRYVIRKGKDNYYYLSCRKDLINTLFLKVTGSGNATAEELSELEKDFLSTIDETGRNANAVPMMLDLAQLYVFHIGEPQKAITLLTEAMAMPAIQPLHLAEARIALGDAYLFIGEVWEATLLYSQAEKMFKNDEIGREAKLKNAKWAYYTGQFDWAEAQLNVLKAATSDYIANDALYLSMLISDNTLLDTNTTALSIFARADLLLFQNRDDAAWAAMDSIVTSFPGHSLSDDIMHRKAQVMVGKKNYVKAVEYLNEVYKTYGNDLLADDALFQMACIYEDVLKEPTKAMQYFQELLLNYPGSLFTVEARKRYRALRGDLLN